MSVPRGLGVCAACDGRVAYGQGPEQVQGRSECARVGVVMRLGAQGLLSERGCSGVGTRPFGFRVGALLRLAVFLAVCVQLCAGCTPAPCVDVLSGVPSDESRLGQQWVLGLRLNGTWDPLLASNTTTKSAIIAGLVGSGGGGSSGWNTAVRPLMSPGMVQVNHTTRILSITIPAASTYNIVQDETVAVSVPRWALAGAVAPPSVSFEIRMRPVCVLTSDVYREAQIVEGGHRFNVTLIGTTVVAAGVFESGDLRRDIARGFRSYNGDTLRSGWDQTMVPFMEELADLSQRVTRVSPLVISFLLPQLPPYSLNLTRSEFIVAELPAGATAFGDTLVCDDGVKIFNDLVNATDGAPEHTETSVHIPGYDDIPESLMGLPRWAYLTLGVVLICVCCACCSVVRRRCCGGGSQVHPDEEYGPPQPAKPPGGTTVLVVHANNGFGVGAVPAQQQQAGPGDHVGLDTYASTTSLGSTVEPTSLHRARSQALGEPQQPQSQSQIDASEAVTPAGASLPEPVVVSDPTPSSVSATTAAAAPVASSGTGQGGQGGDGSGKGEEHWRKVRTQVHATPHRTHHADELRKIFGETLLSRQRSKRG